MAVSVLIFKKSPDRHANPLVLIEVVGYRIDFF
jgi:hypothetical protein